MGLASINKAHGVKVIFMRYSRDAQQELLLVGIMALPVGAQDQARVQRLVVMDDEAFYRARADIVNQLSNEQLRQMDATRERWQVRLSELSLNNATGLRKRLKDGCSNRQCVTSRMPKERVCAEPCSARERTLESTGADVAGYVL